MWTMIGLLLAAGTMVYGYTTARRFVRGRLRYVDAALRSATPIVAGIGAALVTLPLFMWLPLPFFTAWTAGMFGLAVGAGATAGARDIRSGAPLIEGP